MKKHLLALGILASGASLSWVLHSSSIDVSLAGAGTRRTRTTQTETLSQTRRERTALEQRIGELRHELSLNEQIAPRGDLSATATSTNLSPTQSEELLAELGFNWNSTRDFVVVSKDSLKRISLAAMKDMKLTDLACNVLAITPEERSTIDATTQQLGFEYQSWARANVRREDPAGDVVAKYSIAMDPDFSQSLSNRFTAAVLAALGPERSDLLRVYSYSWMGEMGMFGGQPTTLTLRRYLAGENSRLGMELNSAGSSMATDVSPYQPFPAAFRPMFPDGWIGLAQREGFELPKEFSEIKGGKP